MADGDLLHYARTLRRGWLERRVRDGTRAAGSLFRSETDRAAAEKDAAEARAELARMDEEDRRPEGTGG